MLRDEVRQKLIESRPAPSFSPGVQPAKEQPVAALPYSEFSQMLENEASAPLSVIPEQPPAFTLRPAAAPAPRFDFVEAEPAIDPVLVEQVEDSL